MHVVVVDPLPLYQHGVAAVLSSDGYTVETPPDTLAWSRRGLRAVVLLTVDSERAWQLLHALRGRPPGQQVVALVVADPTTTGVRAIRAGAQSVVHRNVEPAALRRAVDATADGQAVMPASVAEALASGLDAADPAGRPLTAAELEWLHRLATGATVGQLAVGVGYSERAMFRRLQAVYRRLGVSTRIEAVVLAQERGWLDLVDPRPAQSRRRQRPR